MTTITSEQLDQLRDAYRAALEDAPKGDAFESIRGKVARAAVLAKRDELGLAGLMSDEEFMQVAKTAKRSDYEETHEPDSAGGDDIEAELDATERVLASGMLPPLPPGGLFPDDHELHIIPGGDETPFLPPMPHVGPWDLSTAEGEQLAARSGVERHPATMSIDAMTKLAAERVAHTLSRDPSTVEGSTVVVKNAAGEVLATAVAPKAETLDSILGAMESAGMSTEDQFHREVAAYTAQRIDETRAVAETVLDTIEAATLDTSNNLKDMS